MEKLLTVIVPSYNMEDYLPNGLASLVVEDEDLLNRLDVIVVNDGSKDRTSEIAHGFEAKYPSVFRVIDKTNGNYGSCVNAALPAAKGRFVRILDADDSYDTAAFGRYLRALAEMPETVDMVISDYVQVDGSGRVTETMRYPFPSGVAFGLKEIMASDCFMAMHAVAYRTTMLREIGYVQTEGISYTDTEWTYLPVAESRDVRAIREPVYRYLLGRAGQTVERTTFAKNVWMQDRILDGMLRQYDAATCEPTAKAYLAWRFLKTYAFAMSLHLEDVFSPSLTPYLEDVRRKAAAYGFIADGVRERAILAATPFRFRYVEFALRHPRLARPTLLAVKAYGHLRGLLRRGR